MKGKYIKYIILILVVLILLIGFKMYKNEDKLFDGGIIYSHWIEGENINAYMVTIDLESGYSQEDVEYFTNIATKKRKKEIYISEAINLGNPTHEMIVYISEKSTRITKWKFKFNLWLKEYIGYIQPQSHENFPNNQFQDFSKISKLDKEEHEFLINSLLKYQNAEDIFKK